jgi:hypothetical protein
MEGDSMSKSKDKIQWHPGFYSAMELELAQNKEALTFEREHNLSKKPLQVDLLIVKKNTEEKIENEIGRIFRKYNILEYKAPNDSMGIDSYFKTVSYACLYKGLGEKENAIPAKELTISMVGEQYPRELIRQLKSLGAKIEEKYPSIYYVSGILPIPTQIVVTKNLDKRLHSSLRVLSEQAQEEDVRRFLTESVNLCTPGDRNNVDSVIQVSAAANKKLYQKLREESAMCEALRELMKDEMEAELEKGMTTGSNATFVANVESLARNLNIPIEEACIKLDRTYEEYLKIKNSL